MANELTNEGLDVVAIERGPWRDAATDFPPNYERESLLFNSSHTHTGPVIRPNLIQAYGLGAADADRVRRYDELEDKLARVIGDALEHMVPVSLTFGSSEAHFAVNRRQATPRAW